MCLLPQMALRKSKKLGEGRQSSEAEVLHKEGTPVNGLHHRKVRGLLQLPCASAAAPMACSCRERPQS